MHDYFCSEQAYVKSMWLPCVHVGIFIPSLTIGGAWGRLIGMLVQACHASSGSTLRVSLPAYTVCAKPQTLQRPSHPHSGSLVSSCQHELYY